MNGNLTTGPIRKKQAASGRRNFLRQPGDNMANGMNPVCHEIVCLILIDKKARENSRSILKKFSKNSFEYDLD
jgi:hypothetical protein